MSDLLVVLTFVAALGAATSGGVFFAFSSFVMAALRRLPPAQGIAAMQSMNVMAPTPVFMTALFGTGALSVVLSVWALADWDGSYSPYLLAGSVIYVASADVLTIGYHVPRNNALAKADPQDPDAAAQWTQYDTEWTRMNHLRVIGALAATALFIVALMAG
jgi:uncharacterized membrane protein